MTDAMFTVHEPERDETALIVEIPHAGVHVPPRYLADLLASGRALGRDADLYVDELYASAHHEGATVLAARTSRYVVDLNRAETDIDPQAVDGTSDGHSPRGLIWRLTTEGDRALLRPLTREAFEARLDAIYRPYHTALARLIERKKARFGYAVVLAAHSMPSIGRVAHGDVGSTRADVVPGTRGRTSADRRLIDAVEAHARAAGYSVAHDEPYKGGFTTQHYGRPAFGVHVVQVEVARRLYMDETTLQHRPGRFQALSTWCRQLVAKLGQTALR